MGASRRRRAHPERSYPSAVIPRYSKGRRVHIRYTPYPVLFNSLTFLLFLPMVWALQHFTRSWSQRKLQLLVASYLFYAAWNPPFVALLWISTAVDWWVARRMGRCQTTWGRRAYLSASLLVNLGFLGYFKYGSFITQNFADALGMVGIHWQPAALDIILPVGISFYTFQTLAYSLDVYHGRSRGDAKLFDFALYVAFFPQLVAGPIVRPDGLLPQFSKPRRATREQLIWGFLLISIGMFNKVAIADGIFAPVTEFVFGYPGPLAPLDAWVGALAFSGQIFCDFSGYSMVAIGCALCLGFSLPDNFQLPYSAVGFSDFWQRWHISLSSWLRDYLYIPMGGNRSGALRTAIHLMVTMLIGGLWHGASWNFVIWGGLHGSFLIAERIMKWRFGHFAVFRRVWVRAGLGALTFVLVTLAWVFFRTQSFDAAIALLSAMFGLLTSGQAVLTSYSIISSLAAIGAIVATHAYMRHRKLEQILERMPTAVIGVGWALILFVLCASQGSDHAFIYFQF